MTEQNTAHDQVVDLERRLIGLIRTCVAPGNTAMLWCSAVGATASCGLLSEDASGAAQPIEAVPAALIELVAVHREATYRRDGRAWVSLLVRVTPGGGAEFTLGHHDTLPWADPVTEADWAEEQRIHPDLPEVRA